MISVIVCSVKEPLRTALKQNIAETIGVNFEVVAIENEKNKWSIAKAYNEGAANARFPYLCFVHEDVRFHTPDWGLNLLRHYEDKKVRLVGILGSLIKTRTHSQVHILQPGANRQNQLQRYANNELDHFYDNPLNETTSEVCVLDGLFISSTKEAWAQTKFSEDYLNGFHGYDIDFSLKNFVKGKVMVVYDILLEHFSLGSFNKSWIDTQLLVTKKWKKQLPLAVTGVSKADIKKAEIANSHEFLRYLVENECRRFLQLNYFLKLTLFYPRRFFQSALLRRVIFGARMERNAQAILSKLRQKATHNAV